MVVELTGAEPTDYVMDCDMIFDRWELRLQHKKSFIVVTKSLFLQLLAEGQLYWCICFGHVALEI